MKTCGRPTEASFSPSASLKTMSNFQLLVHPFQCKNRQWKGKRNNPIYRQDPKPPVSGKKSISWCNSQPVTSEHSSASSLSSGQQYSRPKSHSSVGSTEPSPGVAEDTQSKCLRLQKQLRSTHQPGSVKGSAGILVPKSPAGKYTNTATHTSDGSCTANTHQTG